MTSELKCPICGGDIRYNDSYSTYDCKNNPAEHHASEEVWQALTQAKQDLEIARKALEKLNREYNHCRDEEFEGADIDWEWWAMAAKNVVETALNQIEHKES